MIGGYEEELIKQMIDLALVILNLKNKNIILVINQNILYQGLVSYTDDINIDEPYQ